MQVVVLFSFRIQQQRPDSPELSCLSLKSDVSKDWFIDFKGRRPSADQIVDQEAQRFPVLLEENIVTFEQAEEIRGSESSYPECLESPEEDEEVLSSVRMKSRGGAAEEFLNHTELPEESRQEELAKLSTQSSKRISLKI
ncbi:NACHT, LRR and PYD domains-containing protein 3-like protein [Lates japonicus]|uniref:NACHT, LRR and PYD domains-containing protein 3-like protein n=1 Tax=Lates japonicus TaxID=270547 RepID=A0AAD3NKY9_LATJO|nr:NACHT, LRR and PYD domains-containing protein 3-like protein [Lates japonicus]